jgi:molecular chaperone GrpE
MTLSQDQELKKPGTDSEAEIQSSSSSNSKSAHDSEQANTEGTGDFPDFEAFAASESTSESENEDRTTSIASELAETNDKHLRLLAEFDNYRRRTAREHSDLVATANGKLLGKLTEVLDNFGRAFDPQFATGSAEDFEKGVKLIFARFKEILEEEGLEPVDPIGGDFDPNLHEALLQQVSDTVPENGIMQVVQRGYKVKGSILKHAKVIVSKGLE